MAEYKVYFKESVEKDLNTIPKKDLQKILRRIETLSQEPRPQGHEKLTGQERYRSAKATIESSIPFKTSSSQCGL